MGRAFVALTVLLVSLGVVLVVTATKFSLAGNDVIDKWQPALAASQRMLADLVNQETGVRGYVLTRQSASLAPYTDYVAQEAVDTGEVRRLAGGDRAVVTHLREFTASAEQWRTRVAGPAIALVRAGRRPDVSAIDAGRTEFDRIRSAGAALTATLADRTASARSARKIDGVVAAGTLGLSLVLVAAAGIALWRGLYRWVLRPVDGLTAQVRTVASGDLNRRIEPAGPIELTQLGEDVESMRAQIVTQLQHAEELADGLRRQGAELERSNSDLQQFAYVASHDLSEPLRKVTNFCQLLERQYADQLDDRARQYIDFAVDGAKRMQTLITDLLALSRVGRTTEGFVPVDTGAALDQALATLSDRIADAGARVERPGPLPTVVGDRTLLTSLLENLVGNAVKYRRADVAPVVTVSAEPGTAPGEWIFTVADNGIGIEAQYADRIFAVFQRLHLRDQYEGTGIGLALCRRIVDFHGGRIWLDPVSSAPGATFRFTLPEGGPHVRDAQ